MRKTAPALRRLTRAAVVVALATSLIACGSVSNPQPSGTKSGEVTIEASMNGKSVQAHVGNVLHFSLDRTTWTFGPSSDPSVLVPMGQQVVTPAPQGTCYPGTGCGTTTALYKALAAGSATVTATRVSCGEARRCVGAEGVYQVRVVVGP